MSVRVIIFNKKAYREYTLATSLSHADKRLVLDADFYWIEEDLELLFATADGEWSLQPDEAYNLLEGGSGQPFGETVRLSDGLYLIVETLEGERLSLFVKNSIEALLPYQKYELLPTAASFWIGTEGILADSPEPPKAAGSPAAEPRGRKSGLCYLPRVPFVKEEGSTWARISCADGTFSVIPLRESGIYKNGAAVTGETCLASGDILQIYGLSICIIKHQKKTVVAFYTSYGDCTVSAAAFRAYSGSGDSLPVQRQASETAVFRRSPRQLSPMETGKISIEEPPALDHTEHPGILQAIGSSLLMVLPMVTGCAMMVAASRLSGYGNSLFMYSGLVMALSSAIVGIILGVANIRSQRKQLENARQRRFLAYGQYLIAKRDEIAGKYEGNIASMLANYPPITEVAAYNRRNPELWNRNEQHTDFLKVRIGLGDTPFQMEIEIPKEKFQLYEDELREKPEYIRQNYETLYDVPQILPLREQHLIGLVGGEEKYGAFALARTLIVRLAATHCYTEVKMVFIYDGNSAIDRKQWDFVRHLPHTWSENRRIRYIASTSAEISDVCYSLAGVFRKRLDEADELEDRGPELPYYIIFLSDPSLIEGELIANHIFNHAKKAGITTVILSEFYEDLPNGCNCFVENTGNFAGINNLSIGGEKIPVDFDQLPLHAAEDFARGISNIRVKELNATGELPDSVSFLDMYEAGQVSDLAVEERWLKNKVFENVRGMLGVKGGGVPVFLDVHEKYHGPHGLVAGTTGSGKSETLQTYLLSLAVNYSPDDVSYFIIDYKGGGMANLFDGLPHLAGAISNLSGAQINRAMVSIKAENMRRQRIFNDAGVNNINSYTKLHKNGTAEEPLPHLFIIIDEFAELKREEPDFMKELISVAQVGRSLGVHLILSTQKPSGTVDDNIWSNSRFKLCLRVQTKEDSMEMLGKPDAAYINQAGRCYLEVGTDEIYELFQSGYSGAAYNPLSAGQRGSTSIVNAAGQEEVALSFASSSEAEKGNQLDAVIAYIREEAERLKIGAAHRLWMPILPNPLYLSDLDAYNGTLLDFAQGSYRKQPFKENGEWDVSVAIGQTDDPKNQAQDPLIFSLSEGHTAIVGNAMSGKSTLLLTILYSLATTYSPETVNFYCMDYSSKMLLSLRELPHTGGVMSDGEEEKTARLFNMLSAMLEERKRLFQGGNYAQYVRSQGLALPAILVAIDNFASFNERTGEKHMPEIIKLTKEGIANGIFLILTGAAFNMNEIPGRISAGIGKPYTLALADKFAYGDILHTLHVDVLPETAYKGRGLALVGQSILEYQAALPVPAEDDYARQEKIKQTAVRISQLWRGKRAKAVPEIPEKPTWEDFVQNEDVKAAFASDHLLPIGYQSANAEIYSSDLTNDYCYMIAGLPRTGKRSLLRLMIYSALEKENARLVLIDAGNVYSDIESDRLARIATEEELYDYCVDQLTPLFKERNARKKLLLEQGLEDAEYYAKMADFMPVYLFIASMPWLIKTIYADSHNMSGFMETLIKKGEGHKISFIGIMDLSERASVAGYEIFNAFAGYARGIHLGGNCVQDPYLSFSYLSNMEQARSLPPGLGLLSDSDQSADAAGIVIPLAKRFKKDPAEKNFFEKKD